MKNIALIFPPADSTYQALDRVYPVKLPPSSLAILSMIAESCEYNPVILDGGSMSVGDILGSLQSHPWDVIGISVWSTNHRTAMQIAAYGKKLCPSSSILVGGPHATHLYRQILHNHPYVDGVAVGAGEDCLQDFLTGNIPISNFAWRDDEGHLHDPSIVRVRPNDVPLFDFRHISEFDPSRVPVPVAGIRGCIKAARSGICTYCSIPTGSSIRVQDVDRWWQQAAQLRASHGISYLFETGDDFMVGNWPRRLLERRPDHLRDTTLRIYAYPEKLHPSGSMLLLESLGVKSIFMGIESFTPAALERAGRSANSIEMVEKIIQEAESHHIKLIISFIFGLEGETRQTTLDNISIIRTLVRKYARTLQAVSLSVITPIPGSNLFQTLCATNFADVYQTHTSNRLATSDVIDYETLARLYVEYITRLPYEWLKEQIAQCEATLIEQGLCSSTFMGIEKAK